MGCRGTHIQHGQLNDSMGRIRTLDHHMLDSSACRYSTLSLTDDIVNCCLNGVWRVLVTGLLFICQSLSAYLAFTNCENAILDYLSHSDRVRFYVVRYCRRQVTCVALIRGGSGLRKAEMGNPRENRDEKQHLLHEKHNENIYVHTP